MKTVLKRYLAAKNATPLILILILASCSNPPIVKPSPDVVEIPLTISCFGPEYAPYLKPIVPPWAPDHTDVAYGELKYRYNHLLLLLGESNKDKSAIEYILNQPVE